MPEPDVQPSDMSWDDLETEIGNNLQESTAEITRFHQAAVEVGVSAKERHLAVALLDQVRVNAFQSIQISRLEQALRRAVGNSLTQLGEDDQ